jgi:mono/diheme cytochrome c family protein
VALAVSVAAIVASSQPVAASRGVDLAQHCVEGTMKSIRVRFAWTIALCVVVGLAVHGRESVAQQADPSIKSGTFQPLVSVEGKDNFLAYCAVCHGVSGRGDGPATPALKVPIPDLTTMTKRARKFDRVAVERFIAGVDRVPPAHGSADMPMWGPVFRSQGEPQVTSMRLQHLVKYLESIQQPGS